MAQINLNVTKQFLDDLQKYMKIRKIETKSEAIRQALQEIITTLESHKKKRSFFELIGTGLKVAPRKNPKFKDEDSLWEDD